MTPGKATVSYSKHPAPEEKLFRLMFDSHPASMLLIEPETGIILDANQSAIRFYGYPKSELCGKSIKEIMILLPEQTAAEHQEVTEENHSYPVSLHRLATDEERIVEMHTSLLSLQKKQVLFAIIHDVTSHRKALRTLKISEARYRAVAEFANEGIISTNSAGLIVGWNRGAETIFGYTETEALGQPISMLMPSHSHAKYASNMMHGKNQGKQTMVGKTVEMIGKRKNGSEFPLEHSLSEWNFDDNRFYTAITRDITARKQADEALRDSEERYRTVVSNMPVVTFVTDEKGIFTLSEGKGLEKLGLNPGQVVGLSVFDVYREYPPIIDAMKKALNGHSQRNEVTVQGIVFDVLFSSILDQQGKVTKVIGVSNDVTERKQAEQALRSTTEKLELANRELEQALAREYMLARLDVLTGLYNRRHFFELAAHESSSAMRYQHPLTIIMFDLDDFKQINDTLGHLAGDRLLAMAAQAAAGQMRSADILARYGGDEFIILLPQTSAKDALPVAERIRENIAAIRLETDNEQVGITLSIGIAELGQMKADKNLENVIQLADRALYAAKAEGRNRTVIFNPDSSGES